MATQPTQEQAGKIKIIEPRLQALFAASGISHETHANLSDWGLKLITVFR